jgi:hypothetical protein
MWGALSDERTGLSFTITAGPRQSSHPRVRVSWNWRPHFTVPDSRLPFSSPPTNHRATMEVFDPAYTRDRILVRVNVMLRPAVQSAIPSWNKAPIWGLRPDLYYSQDSCRLVDIGLSLTRGRICYLPDLVSSKSIIDQGWSRCWGRLRPSPTIYIHSQQ